MSTVAQNVVTVVETVLLDALLAARTVVKTLANAASKTPAVKSAYFLALGASAS